MMSRVLVKRALVLVAFTALFLFLIIIKSSDFFIKSERGQTSTDFFITQYDSSAQPEEITNEQPDVQSKTTPNSKVTRFVFVKVEKTGSSTLYNMFARFVLKNNLNMLAPHNKQYCINFMNNQQSQISWDIGPRTDEKAEALINHAKYNQSFIKEHMAPDVKLIVPVRHPVSWFLSAVEFFSGALKKKSAQQILAVDSILYTKRASDSGMESYTIIPQLLWLGFNYSHRENITAIKLFIEDLKTRTDVPILTDQFDASLVMLKRKFNWDILDILYSSKEVSKKKTTYDLPEASIKKLLSSQVNLGDLLLYEAMNETWWRQPELQQADFWDEVNYFSWTNRQISQVVCKRILSRNSFYTLPKSGWHEEGMVTAKHCKMLEMNKFSLLKLMNQYSHGELTDSELSDLI